jgi:hypothetical protein
MTTKAMDKTRPKTTIRVKASSSLAFNSEALWLGKCITTGTDVSRGGMPESLATTTRWASLAFIYLDESKIFKFICSIKTSISAQMQKEIGIFFLTFMTKMVGLKFSGFL